MPRILSTLKNLIVRDIAVPRLIPFGLYKGCNFKINLSNQSQLYFGLWERETYSAIRRGLQNAIWFMDIGAGGGEMCVLALRYPRMVKVFAIDPNASETEKVLENLKLNGITLNGCIEVIQKFAGDHNSSEYVDVSTLEVPRGPGFIKIDVDGAELDVISSLSATLDAFHPSILLETHSLELERLSVEILSDIGYHVQIIDRAWWRLIFPEKREIEHNRWLFAQRSEPHSVHQE